MICIYCGHKTQVINSRLQKKPNHVWRRRQCLSCKSVFTTEESLASGGSLMIKHKSALEPFSRDKLLLSIYDSLKHRKTAVEDATALTLTISGRLYPLIQDATINRADLVEITAETLKRFDKVAFTHYSAFHPLGSL